MGHGVTSGGGQISLGHLFGSGEAPKPVTTNSTSSRTGTGGGVPWTQIEVAKETPEKPITASLSSAVSKEIPAGVPGNKTNNYF